MPNQDDIDKFHDTFGTEPYTFNPASVQSTSSDAETRLLKENIERMSHVVQRGLRMTHDEPHCGWPSGDCVARRELTTIVPYSMTIVEYCTEEVRRQNTHWTQPEELKRVAWMLRAWSDSIERSQHFTRPTLANVVILGMVMEPEANAKGLRDCRVCIQDSHTRQLTNIGSEPALVRSDLEHLLSNWASLSSLNLYRAFELIHPFADGNGRVGKILLNWRNGTLSKEPIFPPNDFWGAPIVNP